MSGLFSARLLCGEARRYLFLYLGEPENPQPEVIKPPRTAYAKDSTKSIGLLKRAVE